MENKSSSLLRMNAITKRFSRNTVLDNVDFSLKSGEILSLLGANGAGKSTLMKILTGVYSLDEGSIFILDKMVSIRKPVDALNNGIRFVPQDLSIMPDLSIGENIFQGQMPLKYGVLPHVDFKNIYKQSKELLNSLGVNDLSPTKLMRDLSVSEQRIVEIARGLAGKAQILILDEPTASLGDAERKKLFSVLSRLREQGMGIIFISHYLDEVFQISDGVTVIRDGCNCGDFITSETDQDTVLAAMLGKETKKLYPPLAQNIGTEVLVLKNVRTNNLLKDVSLTLHEGQIHGVFGLLGSGMEELGKVLFGVIPSVGEFILQGKSFKPVSTKASIRAGIGYVAAERKSEGLILTLSVRENFVLPYLDYYASFIGMDVKKEKSICKKWIDRLQIKTSGGEQKVDNLSGGNQQKVCIGRWLENDIKILILEEPTRGVDLGARKEIYQYLRDLTDRGLSIIVLSSDCEEIAGLCDKTTILYNGESIEEFNAGTPPHVLIAAASGLPVKAEVHS